ncbi:acyl-CoA N-acyltransferase [Cyathus striatus]|nr:acyl-CoA N-acyltransferase [Cyathus striatus]
MPHHTITLTSPTGRLKLAPPSSADDDAVSVLRTLPRIRQYLRFLPETMTAYEAGVRRESRSNDARIMDFHIHLLDDNGSYSLAGMSGLFNIDRANESCETGILVHPNTHGKGIATEALYTLLEYIFEKEKFHRVTFETGADNAPMLQWLDLVAKAKLEAKRRDCWKNMDGSYSNVMGYSILAHEWNGYVKLNLETRLRSARCGDRVDMSH